MGKPIFYDPRQARWRRLRRIFDALAITLSLLVIFFAYSAVRDEPLPELLLPLQKRSFHALSEREKEKAKEHRRKQALARGHRNLKSAPSQVKLNSEEGVRAAFYVSWDAASFSSLREYARQIDLLYPEWLHVLTPDGRLQGVDEQTNDFFDVIQQSTVRPIDSKVMPFLKAENTGIEVFPLVNNFDGSNWLDISGFVKNPASRSLFRQQIAQFLASDKYHGLMVDFEDYPVQSYPDYVTLLRELAGDLHAKGMKLYVSAPANTPEYPYAYVASAVDGVVLMNYDQHDPEHESGPVAGQDWFTDNLAAAKKSIPLDKLICAIANYGYDWVHKPKNGVLPPGVKNFNVSVQDAWSTARDSEADVDFDDDSSNPHIQYVDEHNLDHDVWFLDAVTALNEMRAAQNLGIDTFAIWRLGAEDRSLWKVWDVPGAADAPEKLKDVPPGQDVDMEGQGEILRIEARPADGQRGITVDPSTNLIADENFDSLPQNYRVGRYGYNPNAVALTFDDGPDPEWTPKILDALKAKDVPATFFLIGLQADKFGGVLKRIVKEGHEIGNHTFTHPDISNLSGRYMKLELNLTERLFASRLGLRTILFRPPYSIDAEPDTEDQVRPLETTQDMGYITIGDKIDPNDWRDNPRHSADQLVADVLSHLPPCAANDIHCGNIILLHDGGGDREQTVLALPRIIEGVRAKGLKIVPLYELLGRTRAEVMPPIPSNQRWIARLNLFGFALFPLAFNAMTWIFFVGDVLMTGRLLFIGAFAIFDRLWPRHYGSPGDAANYLPQVAVLIPAYNEEKVIVRTRSE